jgi:predicted DCC family thiol-disulfide oxidoreductase YuxK
VLTVVYDADCGVCQATVAWLRRRGSFDFVGNDADPLPAGVDRAETEHTVVVLDGPRKLVRAQAVSRLLRELRGWSVLGNLMRAPGVRRLADFGYDQFARRRHRVSAALGMTVCDVSAASAPRRPATDRAGAASDKR